MTQFTGGGLRQVANLTRIRSTSTVTFTLDTNIFASGDILADTQALAGSYEIDSPLQLESFVLYDADDQGIALSVVFLSGNKSLGTENSAPNISDANGLSVLGIVPIATTDWVDLGGIRVATKLAVNLQLVPDTGTNGLYVALINGTGTPTFTVNGVTGRFNLVAG